MIIQNEIKLNAEKIKTYATYKINKSILDMILVVIFLWGLWIYRNPVIIIFGLITCGVEFIFEHHCVEKGLWSYKKDSKHMVTSKIPLSVVSIYFLSGAVAVVYVLFRLGL